MSISKFDLGRSISDLEGKNSKFRRIAFLHMATKNISVRFYRFPIKTVGGVRKSTKKCLKLTSLAPAPVEPKIGQPRNICPDATFSKIHLPYQFRDDRTLGTWSKSGNGRTSTVFSETGIQIRFTHQFHNQIEYKQYLKHKLTN